MNFLFYLQLMVVISGFPIFKKKDYSMHGNNGERSNNWKTIHDSFQLLNSDFEFVT